MYQSIVECVYHHALERPDALCLADGAGSFTYAQAWERIAACSGLLAAAGVDRGQYALVECNQSAGFIVWMLAAHLAGVIAVPLERNAAHARVAEIAAETEAVAYIGASLPEGLGKLAFVSAVQAIEPLAGDVAFDAACFDAAGMPVSGDASAAQGAAANRAARAVQAFPGSADVAEILFSTGTTGKSKGIVITQRNNMAIAENVIQGVKMKPGNVEIIPMPLSHSHGLRRTYSNLVNGSTAVIADGVIALKKLFVLMDEYRVTSMDISPSMLSIIIKLSKDRLGNYADVLDYVQLGSAPLSEDDKKRIKQLLPKTRLYNFYGSTEAGCSCLLEFSEGEDKPGCVGAPCVNSQFIIVDENRNPIESSPEHLGFIANSGDVNMLCYFKAPELTAATMQDGFIYTKDLGYIDAEGNVYMLGRKDDVINFGGVKISPEEIESAVRKNPIVRDCACVPLADALTGQSPLLCIALADGATYDFKEFKQFLAHTLDANKQPTRIEVVDEIPRTFNGKIIRRELIARFG